MYYFRDIYPGLGQTSTVEASIPESQDQVVMNLEEERFTVDGRTMRNFWVTILVILFLLWLFNVI